jgi:hypothetical protein
MKKLADSNGAELLPISVTGGISDGRGVVSMRVAWLNLQLQLISVYGCKRALIGSMNYLAGLPDILNVDSQGQEACGRLN